MLVSVHKSMRGVTLIELMVAITIIALLTAVGVPSYQQWIQNTHLRTAAESIQNGLQLARATAVRDNTFTRFMFTGAGQVSGWTVQAANPNVVTPLLFNIPVQSRAGTEGSAQAQVGTSVVLNAAYGVPLAPNSAGMVVFDSLGRIAPASVPRGIAASITRIDVIHSSVSTARRLVILISSGGQIRMCDPALALTVSPQACA